MLVLPYALYAGVMTILAPCIWPLLPIILSTSRSENERFRPLGISLGVVISFTLFALTVSSLAVTFGLPPSFFHAVAVVILLFIGLLLIFPKANRALQKRIQYLALFTERKEHAWDDGFIGGLVTGLVLGLAWSPFAGPILESLTDVAHSKGGPSVVFVTLAYVLGIGLPLLGIAYGGQQLLRPSRQQYVSPRVIQLFFGVFTIVIAIAMAFNIDKWATHLLWSLIIHL
jgi:cytochrome c-type biogenesis protein